MKKTEHLWVEKYRPQTIDECILPDDLKKMFHGFVEQGDMQNMLFHGSAGTGKTTMAKALCEQMGLHYYFINASNENSIDVLRSNITHFVSVGSLTHSGKRKVVILDEADNLSAAFMAALKTFIEEFSNRASFIFTCNHPNKIIDPLRSRLLNVEFNLRAKAPEMAGQYMGRLQDILDKEEITYEPAVLAKLIKMFFPDFRRTLNELQRYSYGKNIDSGIFANIKQVDIEKVMDFMKLDSLEGWKSMREYFDYQADSIDPAGFVNDIYKALNDYLTDESLPSAIVLIDDFSTAASVSVSKKISLIALCSRIMSDCTFK